ncbi:hypothetical protein [Frankia tisae]|nr:hypothetical protein [Frankia tisae]
MIYSRDGGEACVYELAEPLGLAALGTLVSLRPAAGDARPEDRVHC